MKQAHVKCVTKESPAELGSLTMQANETGEMEAACHCGTVRFRVKLTDGFNTARRCTCSYCRMRGAVAVSANVGSITFDAGEEALTVYRFNVACLKGVSPFDFADVPVIDGVNHPADYGRGYEIVGHLRFIRTEDHSVAGGARPNSYG